MGSGTVASPKLTIETEKQSFFRSLAHLASEVDPSAHVESIAYLVLRSVLAPKYPFRLTGGRPASLELLVDLAALRATEQGEVGDPIDRIGVLAPSRRNATAVSGLSPAVETVTGRIKTLPADQIDYLAGLVFIHDLLSSTGRSAGESDTIEKYASTFPDQRRPSRAQLPVALSNEVIATS
jgi:hypothetical protein